MPAVIDNTDGANRNWYTMKTYGDNELAYSETTPYYTDADCKTQAGVNLPASYTIDSKGAYKEVVAVSDKSFKYPQVLDRYQKGTLHEIVSADISSGTYTGRQVYSCYLPKTGDPAENDYVWLGNSDGKGYHKVLSSEVSGYAGRQAYTKISTYIPVGTTPKKGDFVIEDGLYFALLDANNVAYYDGGKFYTYASSTFTPIAEGSKLNATDVAGGKHYVALGENKQIIPYYEAGTYYKRDNNYFMVVPTNNITNYCDKITKEEEVKLRTVRVMIEYYITTEDSKLANGFAQTKNVIVKDVVFPSIANGKSYNLNLVLGLTSVKMEAEVDDWTTTEADINLPQNTAE
jgi:hypothetical protein